MTISEEAMLSPNERRVLDLLRVMLSAAVPLWIEELKREPWELIALAARHCADLVAEKGDVLQYHQKGQSRKAFDALAKGLACLSFAPGGVKAFGLHFQAKHLGPKD